MSYLLLSLAWSAWGLVIGAAGVGMVETLSRP